MEHTIPTNKRRPGRRRRNGLSAARLRVFAQCVADICAKIGLVEFDIVCEFRPREREEYGTVEARGERHGRRQRIEGVFAAGRRTRPETGE